MSKSSILFLFLLLINVIHHLGRIYPNLESSNVLLAVAAAADHCSGGSIGECVAEEMESESSRRVLLMGKKYISYETLKRDIVPCNRPGASYYKCDAPQANPYTRGCEVISGCRNSISTINN